MSTYNKNHTIITRILCALGAILMLSFLFLTLRFPTKFNDEVMQASKAHGVSPALIHAVILAESSYNPYAVSHAGAVGLMQLMPATAEFVAGRMGLEFNKEMLFDPAYNINLGTYYLARLLRRFNCTQRAIAAYNAGEGRVASWIANDVDPIPFPETRTYLRRVQFFYRVYRFKGL